MIITIITIITIIMIIMVIMITIIRDGGFEVAAKEAFHAHRRGLDFVGSRLMHP
jgi:hypothetical protein